MRKQTNETYEQWAERVRTYEYTIALQKIANGVSVNEVIERMSKNISKKMLHPIFEEINNIPIDKDAFETSKAIYEEEFLKRIPRAADNVD